mgnify:CR=1 FL=1
MSEYTHNVPKDDPTEDGVYLCKTFFHFTPTSEGTPVNIEFKDGEWQGLPAMRGVYDWELTEYKII